ncbi:MAG: hypothetical protein IKC24_09220 [Oscillospiraceae bacterium]|nr:hypothetical protein [Oscillospiraceae bacterium]
MDFKKMLQNMDLDDMKDRVEDIAEEIRKDPALLNQFKTEPVKALEKVLGVDLPDDVVNKVIAAVKAQMAADKLDDKLDQLEDKLEGKVDLLKKLF